MATSIYHLEDTLRLPGFEAEIAATRKRNSGVLPSQEIRELIRHNRITASLEISEALIQPASLDLRLGSTAYRVQASFLPGRNSTVKEKINDLVMNRIDLTEKSVLERGCVYIVPLLEELALPADMWAKANPKSTTGRLDIFTRLITDYGNAFEEVASGYRGNLYAEIVPRTFSIAVKKGMRLSQLRFLKGDAVSKDNQLSALHRTHRLALTGEENEAKLDIDGGLRFTLNLPRGAGEVVAYRAKKTTPVVDLECINHYDPEEFWDVKYQNSRGRIILDPGDFYILASKERVRVPPEYAAEMVPIDTSIGEFRSHYAGFFDPGFGFSESEGTQAVLEVRAHEVPFVLEHEQTVGRLEYMPLLCAPDKLYGTDIGSSYNRQALTLSKQFKRL